MGQVLVLARCIHHHKNMVTAIGQHQVVLDTALIIGEKAIALTVKTQAQNVHGDQAFQR